MNRPTEEEIRYAHDVMHCVLDKSEEFQLDEEEVGHVLGICYALGWVLGEKCGNEVQTALTSAVKMVQDAGYEMVQKETAQ